MYVLGGFVDILNGFIKIIIDNVIFEIFKYVFVLIFKY